MTTLSPDKRITWWHHHVTNLWWWWVDWGTPLRVQSPVSGSHQVSRPWWRHRSPPCDRHTATGTRWHSHQTHCCRNTLTLTCSNSTVFACECHVWHCSSQTHCCSVTRVTLQHVCVSACSCTAVWGTTCDTAAVKHTAAGTRVTLFTSNTLLACESRRHCSHANTLLACESRRHSHVFDVSHTAAVNTMWVTHIKHTAAGTRRHSHANTLLHVSVTCDTAAVKHTAAVNDVDTHMQTHCLHVNTSTLTSNTLPAGTRLTLSVERVHCCSEHDVSHSHVFDVSHTAAVNTMWHSHVQTALCLHVSHVDTHIKQHCVCMWVSRVTLQQSNTLLQCHTSFTAAVKHTAAGTRWHSHANTLLACESRWHSHVWCESHCCRNMFDTQCQTCSLLAVNTCDTHIKHTAAVNTFDTHIERVHCCSVFDVTLTSNTLLQWTRLTLSVKRVHC